MSDFHLLGHGARRFRNPDDLPMGGDEGQPEHDDQNEVALAEAELPHGSPVLDKTIREFVTEFDKIKKIDGHWYGLSTLPPNDKTIEETEKYIVRKINEKHRNLIYKCKDMPYEGELAGFLILKWEYMEEYANKQTHFIENDSYQDFMSLESYDDSNSIKRSAEKLSTIKNEITKCIRTICERGAVVLSDDKRAPLEKDIVRSITLATLPEKAPEVFDPKKDGRGEIVKFLDRVWYDPWIAEGVFTRSYFRRRDPRGAVALDNYIRQPGHTLPFDIPTKSQELDRDLSDVEERRSAWRMARAAARRRGKDPAGDGPTR